MSCEWCHKDEVFTTVIMHQCGPDYYNIVCRSCLISLVNQQIENIRENMYEGIELNDKNDPNSGNREVLELQILRDICFLGLN